MGSFFDVLDVTYNPSAAYSFEFFERDSLTGKIGKKLTELFFLLPPEEYSIREGFKITVNKTIDGAWVDDYGNDTKDIKISGSLYTYYVGTPAKTNISANSLPPLLRNLKNQGVGLNNEFKKLVNSFTSQIGLDVPGLDVISGLDEFFKLRYIISRFRDSRPRKNLTADHAIVKKFPDLDPIMVRAQQNKKLFKDIAVVYHDYDDNNHYEVVFNDFDMSRSSKDPFTVNYKISLTGLNEFSNQYSGIGYSKKKEDPFTVLNEITNEINSIGEEILAIKNLPANLLIAASSIVSFSSNTAENVQNIIKNLGIAAENEIEKISREGDNLLIECEKFISTITINAFPEKQGETINDIIEKYENEEDGYEIDNENFLNVLNESKKLSKNSLRLKSIDKFFSDYFSEISFSNEKSINQDDFDIDFVNLEKQNNDLITRDRYYYQVIQGDTLQSLSNKFYGNREQYSIISEANDINNQNFENDGMVGENIIIPALFNTESKESNLNLVYYTKKKMSTPKERQIQILGNDLDLSQNRDFIIDGSGDFALVYGEDCYFENIIDRTKYFSGSLNPEHPGWGVIIETGMVPSSILIQKIYDSIEQQVSLDPRTEYVYINRETSNIISDSINIYLNYKPINGQEKTINIGNIIAGLIV